MNAIPIYVAVARLAFQPSYKLSQHDLLILNSKIPELRQLLACVVCCKLVMDPFKPNLGDCQHNVCRLCMRGRKQLYPKCKNCTNCDNFKTYRENMQLASLVACYKNLCLTMKTMGIYDRLTGYRSHQPTQYGKNSSIPLPNMTVQEFIDEGAMYDDMWNKFNEDLPHSFVDISPSTQIPLLLDTPPSTGESFATDDHLTLDKSTDIMDMIYLHQNDENEIALQHSITPEELERFSPTNEFEPFMQMGEDIYSEATTTMHTLTPTNNMSFSETILQVSSKTLVNQNQDQKIQTDWMGNVDLSEALQISDMPGAESYSDETNIGNIIDTSDPSVISFSELTSHGEYCTDETNIGNILETTSSTVISYSGLATSAESCTNVTNIGNIIDTTTPTVIVIPGVSTSNESCTDVTNLIDTTAPTVISIMNVTQSTSESCTEETKIGNIIDTTSPTVISIMNVTQSTSESCTEETNIGNIIDTTAPTVISIMDVTQSTSESCTEETNIGNIIDTTAPTVISLMDVTQSSESCTEETNIGNIINATDPSVISIPIVNKSSASGTKLNNRINTSLAGVSILEVATSSESCTNLTNTSNINTTCTPVTTVPVVATSSKSCTNVTNTRNINTMCTAVTTVPVVATSSKSCRNESITTNINMTSTAVTSLPGVARSSESCTNETNTGSMSTTSPEVISISAVATSSESCANVTNIIETASLTVTSDTQKEACAMEITETPVSETKSQSVPITTGTVTTTTLSSRTEESDIELMSPPKKRRRSSFSSIIDGFCADDSFATSSNVEIPHNNIDAHTQNSVSNSISPSPSTATTEPISSPKKGQPCGCGKSSLKKLTNFTCFRRRCPCYRDNLPCTDKCKCVGCCNPHKATINGTNVTSTTISTRTNFDTEIVDLDDDVQQAIPTVSSTTSKNNNNNNNNNIIPELEGATKSEPEQPLVVVHNEDGECQLVKLFDQDGKPVYNPIKLGFEPVEIAINEGNTIRSTIAYCVPISNTAPTTTTPKIGPVTHISGNGGNIKDSIVKNHIDQKTTTNPSSTKTTKMNGTPHPLKREATPPNHCSKLDIISSLQTLTPANSRNSPQLDDDSCSNFSGHSHDTIQALTNDLEFLHTFDFGSARKLF